MSYINVGAYIGGKRPASKKALREALANAPKSVMFDVTSVFHTGPTTYTRDTIPAGDTLSVTGPDPYNSRKWYAMVTVRDGKATVK